MMSKLLDWLDVRLNRIKAIKWLLAGVIFAFAALMLIGNNVKDVDMEVIRTAINNSGRLGTLYEADGNAVKKTFDIDVQETDGFVMYTSDSIMDVSELFIAKCRDATKMNALQAAVEARLSSQKASFENYGTDQSFLLKNAVLEVRGEYLFYAVGENAAALKSVFSSCIG